MKRFCQECGHESSIDDLICINCGKKLPEFQNKESLNKVTKKNWTKKKKITFSIIGILILLIVCSSIFTSSYFSEQSTMERFNEALSNKDSKKLANILVHEDGSSINLQEAEAFIDLEKEFGKEYIEDFISIQPSEKFLGLFQTFKVYAINQYAYFNGSSEGIEFKFNNQSAKEEKFEDNIIFGPLVPGNYTVSLNLNNDFGNATLEQELSLNSKSYDQIEIEVPISEATIYIDNFNEEMMSDIYVLINNQKVPLTDGESETFGPIFLNGSTTATLVAQYPWGEVRSEEYKLEDSSVALNAPILSEEEYTKISTMLLDFGEQFAHAKASKDLSKFNQVTNNFKEEFEYDALSYLSEDSFYTGQLDKLELDRNSIYLTNDNNVSIDSTYYYTEALYFSDEKPETESVDYDLTLSLLYNKETKNWLVDSYDYLFWSNSEPTDTFEGSKTLYSPNKND
ncbi:TcaA 3rd/4th domain-containing protein [Ureibacillus galli]